LESDEPPKEIVITGEELFRSMAAELGKVPEEESARRAFNTLVEFWNVSPVSEGDLLAQVNEMERVAQDRKLRLYRFSGNLGGLLRIDYPAALELNIPGMVGKNMERWLKENDLPKTVSEFGKTWKKFLSATKP
jgi:hypothetical protein